MTHSALTLSRLARLERMYDGAIPAHLRAWALSGAPPAPKLEPAADLRKRAAGAFADAKRQLREARRNVVHADWSVNAAQRRWHDERRTLLRQEARRCLALWAETRAQERGGAQTLPLAAE
jgi:hypothetical protein